MLIALALAMPIVGPFLCGWLFAKPYGSFGAFRP